MDGGERGVRGWPGLRQESDDEAGEYVAASGGSQSCIACIVDEPVPAWRGDDAAAALEDNRGAVAGAEFAGRGDPVRLDFLSAAAEQASRLRWVWGEHGRRGASGEYGAEVAVGGDEVERVGVEHQRQVGIQCPFEQLACRFAAPKAWSGGKCGEVGGEQIVGAAQHELGLVRVDARRVGIDEA